MHTAARLEVIPAKETSYYEGYSVVSFELFDEGKQTRLNLTHEGMETFPANNPDVAKENFNQGWAYTTGTSLKEHVEK